MNSKSVKFFIAMVSSLSNLLKATNINKHLIPSLEELVKKATNKVREYQEISKDAEYMKTLSPAEQKALYNNAAAVYNFYGEVSKELDYLDMSKHSSFVSSAINALDRAYIIAEALYSQIEECPEVVVAHLTCIKVKDFDKATYKVQMDSLSGELDAFIADFKDEHIQELVSEWISRDVLIHALTLVMEAYGWILKEVERLETASLPEGKKFEFPKETIPEIPAGPETGEKTN